MNVFEIDKKKHAIPAPRASGRYPFHTMKVGDSITLSSRGDFFLVRASAYARATRSRGAEKFACRKVAEGEWRVWRIK